MKKDINKTNESENTCENRQVVEAIKPKKRKLVLKRAEMEPVEINLETYDWDALEIGGTRVVESMILAINDILNDKMVNEDVYITDGCDCGVYEVKFEDIYKLTTIGECNLLSTKDIEEKYTEHTDLFNAKDSNGYTWKYYLTEHVLTIFDEHWFTIESTLTGPSDEEINKMYVLFADQDMYEDEDDVMGTISYTIKKDGDVVYDNVIYTDDIDDFLIRRPLDVWNSMIETFRRRLL